MQPTLTDAELVAGHLAGDRGALAAIYDRYADSLYDTASAMTRQRHDAADVLQDVFVAAAERMGQLRDPHKLKPWLFAILRNEVYRRTGRKRRTVPTDFSDPVAEMTLPGRPADDAADVEFEELAALVRAASAGLDERDRLVLELSIRQGLKGDDLADALGVSSQQCYGLVHRMRQRTERSLGAYCVARSGRKDCPELAEILRGWNGEFSVLIRKRVARHVDGCETCERSRRTLAPFALFGAAPVLAAPPELRDRVLRAAAEPHPTPAYAFEAPGGFPSVIKDARRFGLWMFLAAAILFVGVGTTVYVLADGEPSVAIDATKTSGVGTAATSDAETRNDTVGGPTTVAGGPLADASGVGTTVAAVPGAASSSSTSAPSTSPTTTTPGSTTVSSTTIVAILPPASTVVGTTVPTVAPTTIAPTTATTVPPPATPAITPTTTTTTTPTTIVPTTTPTTTAPPGSLTVSAGSIDFGTTVNQATVSLSNPGGQPVDWGTSTGPATFRGGASPFTYTPASGTLQPGASVQVTFTIDRTWPKEGPLDGERVTFFATGTSAAIDLGGVIARPPDVRIVDGPPALLCNKGLNGLFWEIAIFDETQPVRAALKVTFPDAVVVTDTFAPDGNWYGGVSLDPDGDGVIPNGRYRWTITAVDGLGNPRDVVGQTSIGTDSVHC